MPTRQQLNQREIDGVLSRYRLGSIRSINELAAGSLYSPKVVIESERGKLLLKRRARGLDLPALVAFSHEVILGCLERGLCVPPLLGTSGANNSMTQFEDQVYELFVFIEGVEFDRSPEMIAAHAAQAGALLRETHAALDAITTGFEAPVEPETIDLSRIDLLARIGSISKHDRAALERILRFGAELAKANQRPRAIVHGDWHPGNMIFRGAEIVAICDFDNTRLGSRLREVAQALVHCSLKAPKRGQTAAECDPDPDCAALAGFWRGYTAQNTDPEPQSACAALMPAVMIDEALATLPTQYQGGQGDALGSMMVAVARKAIWMDEHLESLGSVLESAPG